MADENPSRSAPGAGAKNSRPSPSPLKTARMRRRAYRRSKRRRNIVIVIVVVVVIVGGVFLWRYLSSYESTDDAQADVHLYPVSARISGYVVKVNVDDNQWVQQGTVLVEIDPKDYEVAVAQAQANLASAEATAQSLNITIPITSVNTSSQLKSTASDIENADAGVIAAERQLTAAHAQLEAGRGERCARARRSSPLQAFGRQTGSGRSRFTTRHWPRPNPAQRRWPRPAPMNRPRSNSCSRPEAAWSQANANHQSAETGPQQVSSTRARVRAAIADVEQKRALLEQAQLNLQYTKIVAPVTRRSEQNGRRRAERSTRAATPHGGAAR